MRNRTADLLLTMETLYLLSYRGQPTTNHTWAATITTNRVRVAVTARPIRP